MALSDNNMMTIAHINILREHMAVLVNTLPTDLFAIEYLKDDIHKLRGRLIQVCNHDNRLHKFTQLIRSTETKNQDK